MYILIALIIIASITAICINYCFYNFQGNNYFPENILLIALILLIFNFGLNLMYGNKSNQSMLGKELLYFFGIMSLIALATNAVQLTPFPAIDEAILSLEKKANINMGAILAWTNNHPILKTILK